MDRQGVEGRVSDTAATVGDMVSDLVPQTETSVEGKLDQGKSMLHGLRANAGEAVDEAIDLARTASTVGGQAVARAGEAIQGAAREVGNKAGEAATKLYQHGGRAGEYVSRYAADQPLTALLIAGALGYGLAYLIHRR